MQVPVISKNGKAIVVIPDEKLPKPDVKKGKTTTEALAGLVGSAVAVAAAFGVFTPEQATAASAVSGEMVGVISGVALPAVYIVCRTFLKAINIFRG
jgi:hypothetical protein